MFRPAAVVLSLVLAVSLTACDGPRPVETLRTWGDWYFKQQEYDKAAGEYGEITDRLPGDWEAQYQLGLCFIETGRYDEARTALEIALTRRPKNEDVADALADAMFHQGNQNELFAFLRGRAESQQSVHAHLRRAEYALKLSDPDTAKVAIETAIVIDNGQTIEPYLIAADFAQQLGDLEMAVRRLRQAYGIDPYNKIVKQRLRDLGEIPGPTIALPPGR